MQSRLLPSNGEYEACFTHARLGLSICDRMGNVVYESRPLESRGHFGWQRNTMPIAGGQVIWYQDVRELQRKRKQLQLTLHTLERFNRLFRNRERIERDLVQQEVQKRIWQDVESILQSKAALFQQYARSLKSMGTGEKARQTICRLNVLACYLKKQCVLLLRGQEQGQLPVRELLLAFRELFHYLEKLRLKTLMDFQLEGRMPTAAAQSLYAFLEVTSEAAVRNGETDQICRLEKRDGEFVLSLLWSPNNWSRGFAARQQERSQNGQGEVVLKELEYGQSLIFRIKEGGRRP